MLTKRESGTDIAEESARTTQSRLVDVQIHLAKTTVLSRAKTQGIVIKKVSVLFQKMLVTLLLQFL